MKDFSSLTEMESTISGVLRNEYITSFLIMVISLYSGLVAPNLPYHFTKLFDSHIFNLIVL